MSKQVCLLLFTEQPTITIQPQAQEKNEGDSVTLSCKADGNPVPTISWIINGSPIDVRGNSRISFSKNKEQLTIRDVKRTDSGAYRCVASNKFGNATSEVASLDIQCNENVMFIQLPNVARALAPRAEGGGWVLPYRRLMGMCRWMGSHCQDWIDYNRVTF